MTRRNPVAKHANTYNRAATHVDRSKEPEAEPTIEEDDFIECPACGGDQYKGQAYLGGLGRHDHYRCRYCGFYFSTEDES